VVQNQLDKSSRLVNYTRLVEPAAADTDCALMDDADAHVMRTARDGLLDVAMADSSDDGERAMADQDMMALQAYETDMIGKRQAVRCRYDVHNHVKCRSRRP
jgi:hypothetical protein